MIYLNTVISLLAEIAMGICALITVWMVDSKLGFITLGTYIIKQIADILMRREYDKQMKNLMDKAEKL